MDRGQDAMTIINNPSLNEKKEVKLDENEMKSWYHEQSVRSTFHDKLWVSYVQNTVKKGSVIQNLRI